MLLLPNITNSKEAFYIGWILLTNIVENVDPLTMKLKIALKEVLPILISLYTIVSNQNNIDPLVLVQTLVLRTISHTLMLSDPNQPIIIHQQLLKEITTGALTSHPMQL